MKRKEWNEGLNYIDLDIVEKYIAQKERLQKKKSFKSVCVRIGAIAACFALIIGAAIVVPLLSEGDLGIIPTPNIRPNIPIVDRYEASVEPKYCRIRGDGGDSSGGVHHEHYSFGMSVEAQLIEVLPDSYNFFSDWNQSEYRLLKMKPVKTLRGQEITEEFYYAIYIDYLTDFSVFDRFVIHNMAQYAHEYSVMYNRTQDKAEQLNLVLFGTDHYSPILLQFMAFDAEGNFDERLWTANEKWIDATAGWSAPDTITQVEAEIQRENGEGFENFSDRMYTHLLKDIQGEATTVLEQVKSFENGLFVPTIHYSGLEGVIYGLEFRAIRYINGFATNEEFHIQSDRSFQYTHTFTKARFCEEDMNRLPDLTSAFEAAKAALNNGTVTPPHIEDYASLRIFSDGVFAWYAKTENGVVGIIKASWRYIKDVSDSRKEEYCDDAYYIVEYGSNECKAIDRDDLLELLGDYETTYVYMGEYDNQGQKEAF